MIEYLPPQPYAVTWNDCSSKTQTPPHYDHRRKEEAGRTYWDQFPKPLGRRLQRRQRKRREEKGKGKGIRIIPSGELQ